MRIKQEQKTDGWTTVTICEVVGDLEKPIGILRFWDFTSVLLFSVCLRFVLPEYNSTFGVHVCVY